MARRSSIDSLPLEMKIELKRRLRARQQTQLDITAWLNERGYQITKSALNRYSMRIEEEDARLGIDRELLAKSQVDLMALFEELAVIKSREAEIMAEIQQRMLSDSGIGAEDSRPSPA